MAYRRRHRATTTVKDWRAYNVEAVVRGMYDTWTGNEGTSLEASVARLTGATQSEAKNYTNSPYYKLGCETGKMVRLLAQNNKLFPSSEGELGRLVLGEATNFAESIVDSADDFIDDPLGSLAAMFS